MSTHHSSKIEQINRFEHPMNESMRLSLRIEALYSQVFLAMEQKQTQSALVYFLKLIDVLDRPDLKGKLSHTLNQYAGSLNQLKKHQQVDTTRLQHVLDRINTLNTMLHQECDKPTDKFKKITFLNQLRLQLTSPGGISSHANYALKAWNSQSHQKKIADLQAWLEKLSTIQNCNQFILNITRDSSQSLHCTAQQGQYHTELRSNQQLGLIQISVPAECLLYPEISASKHHISVRFLNPNFHETEQAQLTETDVAFTLTMCQL